MDFDGSTLELVREAENMHTLDHSVTTDSSLNDSSSGYGSDEMDEKSSTGRDVNFASKPVERIRSKSTNDEVMLYTSPNNLLHSLECMIAMPEICDITFLVGCQMTPVYGVKAILMTRSRVLYQMILSCQKETLLKNKSKKTAHKARMVNGRLTIHIDGYDDVVFRQLNKFVHCGKVQLDAQNVVGLLCAASDFQLSDLKQACEDFINRIAIAGRISELEMTCADYNNHSAARRILEMINLQRKETVV